MVKLPSRNLEEVRKQNLNPKKVLQFAYQLKIFTKKNMPVEEVQALCKLYIRFPRLHSSMDKSYNVMSSFFILDAVTFVLYSVIAYTKVERINV
jgi:hypothetical protein